MEASPKRMESQVMKLSGSIVAIIGVMASIALYSYIRLNQAQENLMEVNQFYVPVLKHLNLLNGKWLAYQRSFEQFVSFRKWGTKHLELGTPKLHLKKMIEVSLIELEKIHHKISNSQNIPEQAEVVILMERLTAAANQESTALAELASFVHARKFSDAAAIYSRLKQAHAAFTQSLTAVNREIETKLIESQLDIEKELRNSQGVILTLILASLILSLLVLLRLRRWFVPLVEWTKVAQEISLKGIHAKTIFPKVTRRTPAEIAVLTTEFTRMGRTVLERELTIHQQKERLNHLNEHLQEQNQRLIKLGCLNERILNGMSSGILVLRFLENGKAIVEQFNEKYCELFSIDKKNLLGTSAEHLLQVWPVDLAKQWMKTTQSLHFNRVIFQKKTFEIRVQPLPMQSGTLLLFEDVTQIVETEEKLAHLKKLVLALNMSSQMAHEIRNPLNSMSLQLEMLQEDLENMQDKNLLTRVSAVFDQVQRLDRMTQRYFSMKVQETTEPEQQVDMHELIEKSLTFLKEEFQRFHILVQLNLKAANFNVRADADALYQVLLNLIRNAIEAMSYMSENERILSIKTKNEYGMLCVHVNDSGPGVEESLRTRLFEPFVTNKANGHGLGLSISRQICIEHGGELKLEGSERGTSFEFFIPIKGEDHASHLSR